VKKIACPEITPIAEKMAEAVGIEACEDKEELREQLAEIVPIYLLVRSSEHIKFKPSDEAANLRRVADALATDENARTELLRKFPLEWRARVGYHGPSDRDQGPTQNSGVDLLDRLIESAMSNEADLRLLIRWMRRTARSLGYARAGPPVQCARRYAICELEQLLEDIRGASATSTQPDGTTRVRWELLRLFSGTFFRGLGETVDDESLRNVRRSLSSPTS
jgi:hypothetical protein